MKMIALGAVVAMILLDLLGTRSSVGGPMGMLMISFVIILAVGIYEAWANQRGPLGWIVNLVTALLGGLVAIIIEGMLMEATLPLLRLDGSLASSTNPAKYLLYAAMALLTVLGPWAALQIINRFRQGPTHRAAES